MDPAPSETPAFGGWAASYLRFRPGYPAAVFDLLAALAAPHLGLCVELGAGSGQATGDLLARFAQVAAVEPDAAMAALIPAAPRLQVHLAAAETVSFPPGSVDAVAAATALHWMPQAEVVRAAAGWLRPGGVFMAFAFGKAQYPQLPGAAQDLLQRETLRARPHMHDRLVSFTPYEDTLRASRRFAAVEAFEFMTEWTWGAEEVVGFWASTSFGRALAESSGDAGAFLDDLTQRFAGLARAGPTLVRMPVRGAYGRTPVSV